MRGNTTHGTIITHAAWRGALHIWGTQHTHGLGRTQHTLEGTRHTHGGAGMAGGSLGLSLDESKSSNLREEQG